MSHVAHKPAAFSDYQWRRRPRGCAWCGQELVCTGAGRKRKYCSHACRQRAYEQRVQLRGTSLPAEAVILTADAAARLRDELFALRCAAEDVYTAAENKEDYETIKALSRDVVALAQHAEKLRGQGA